MFLYSMVLVPYLSKTRTSKTDTLVIGLTEAPELRKPYNVAVVWHLANKLVRIVMGCAQVQTTTI